MAVTCFAQTRPAISVTILSKQQTDQLLSAQLKKTFNIAFPIFRTYKYTDKSGEYYMVLTESNDKITADTAGKDTISYKIRAVNLKRSPGGLIKQWEMNDFIIKNHEYGEMEERIWFWTKYSSFTDIDHDGLVEPILVYGAAGINGYDDGRIKILTWYKGKKVAFGFQNSVSDYGRDTQYDDALNHLPKTIQQHVFGLLERIEKDHESAK